MDKRFQHLMVSIILPYAITDALWINQMVNLYTSMMSDDMDSDKRSEQALYAMATFPFGALIASNVIGWTFDKFGPNKANVL